MTPTFAVAPVKDGKLCLSEAQKKSINAYLKQMEGQDVRVTFSQRTKTRSNNQNKYMWSVVYAMIASETGHTSEEIHSYCKARFLPKSFITVAGKEVEVEKSTASLSTAEMEEYLNEVRTFAAQELGMTIPLPGQIDF